MSQGLPRVLLLAVVGQLCTGSPERPSVDRRHPTNQIERTIIW